MKKFQNQGVLAIITKIKKGEMHSLRCLLKKMVPPHSDVEYNDKVPFAKLITIHMARFVVVDKSMNECAKLGSIEPFLLLTTNYDYPLKKHLKELVEVAGKGLDEIYGHCEGYPDPKGNDNGKRLKYLKKHMT